MFSNNFSQIFDKKNFLFNNSEPTAIGQVPGKYPVTQYKTSSFEVFTVKVESA